MRIPRVSISIYMNQIFVGACKKFKEKMPLFYGTIGFGILSALFSAILLIPFPLFHNPTINNTILRWIFDHGTLWLVIGISLLAITIIAATGSRVEVRPSDKILKRLYLKYLRQKVERYMLNGDFVGRNYHAISLEDAYIPQLFLDNLPLTDYPLTDAELLYYQTRQNEKKSTEDEDRLLYAAKYADKDSSENYYGWERKLDVNEKMSFADIQKEVEKGIDSSEQVPSVVVIEGFPCSGKSTLIAWLLLCTTHRGLRRSGRKNKKSFKCFRLKPALIPIYVNLGAYAQLYINTSGLTIFEYLKQTMQVMEVESVINYLERCLTSGHCLVLLDGLDEIGKLNEIEQVKVKNAFLDFINFCCLQQEGKRFNRVIITSRVSIYNRYFRGYLRNLYLHYIIKDFTPEQIKCFCIHWFTNSRRDTTRRCIIPLHRSKRVAMEAARQQTDKFYQEASTWEGIRELIKYPLGLVWLLILYDKGIDFPRQRVKLYEKIATTILASGKDVNGQSIISEEIVIQRLGPLAFKMQIDLTSFLSFDQIMESIRQTISKEVLTDGQNIDDETEAFFKYLHLTCNILARRTGSFYGFVYPFLQQYVTARYICLVGEKGSDQEFENLITKLFQSNADWQEVLVLAVTYAGKENIQVIKKILKTVLLFSMNNNLGEQTSIFIGTCLVHDCVLLDDSEVEKLAAERLFYIYEESQRLKKHEICYQIAESLYLWSKVLLEESRRSCPIWNILQSTLNGEGNPSRLQACISLLVEIVRLPAFQSLDMLEPLIPSLMALIGLSVAANYQAVTSLKVTPDKSLMSNTLSLLLLIGEKETNKRLLDALRQYVEVQSTTSSFPPM